MATCKGNLNQLLVWPKTGKQTLWHWLVTVSISTKGKSNCYWVDCQYSKRPVNTHCNNDGLQGRFRPACGKRMLTLRHHTKRPENTRYKKDGLQGQPGPAYGKRLRYYLSPSWQNTRNTHNAIMTGYRVYFDQRQKNVLLKNCKYSSRPNCKNGRLQGQISTSGKKCITLRRQHDKTPVNT
jgi:hypothetical protein